VRHTEWPLSAKGMFQTQEENEETPENGGTSGISEANKGQ